jgi:predicted RNA methylase
MRAGDSSGVASRPVGVPGAAEVLVAAEVPVVVGEMAVVVGALEAGALATGTMTARVARTAAKAARRVREIEWEPTRARYAGA